MKGDKQEIHPVLPSIMFNKMLKLYILFLIKNKYFPRKGPLCGEAQGGTVTLNYIKLNLRRCDLLKSNLEGLD